MAINVVGEIDLYETAMFNEKTAEIFEEGKR